MKFNQTMKEYPSWEIIHSDRKKDEYTYSHNKFPIVVTNKKGTLSYAYLEYEGSYSDTDCIVILIEKELRDTLDIIQRLKKYDIYMKSHDSFPLSFINEETETVVCLSSKSQTEEKPITEYPLQDIKRLKRVGGCSFSEDSLQGVINLCRGNRVMYIYQNNVILVGKRAHSSNIYNLVFPLPISVNEFVRKVFYEEDVTDVHYLKNGLEKYAVATSI